MFELIESALQAVWEFLKKVWVKVCSFVKNILGFFKNPQRLQKLKEDQNLIAVAIKKNLDDGNFQTVNCLFNKEEGILENPKEDALVVTSEELDPQLEQAFGNKDMIVLN